VRQAFGLDGFWGLDLRRMYRYILHSYTRIGLN
jgi:hypothetical protein